MENSQQLSSPPQTVAAKTILSKLLAVVVIAGAIFGSFQYGLAQGKKGYSFEPTQFKVVNAENHPKEINYNLLWNAINVVKQKYIEQSANDEAILYGATRGAVAAMGDQYTEYFEPKTLESFKTDLKGSFGGIGAEIGQKNDTLVIIAPIDDSPAKKAGIMAGDYIIAVDGVSTAGWSVEEAVSKIRGDLGTQVTLSLVREGKLQPFDLTITRDEIKIKSVKVDIKEKDGVKIAVIKLTRFGDDTNRLFLEAVRQLAAENINHVVLDVRNDPGGYLETAVDLASHWVNKGGLIVSEERKNPNQNKRYESFGYGSFTGHKTVVLINGGSASASEILAGALRDNGKAILIGEKSFGKGSVQELIELKEGGAVKVTVAKWVTPGGVNLNKGGLKPDIEVKLSEEDIVNQRDPQLDKALEEVLKR